MILLNYILHCNIAISFMYLTKAIKKLLHEKPDKNMPACAVFYLQ